MAAASADRNLLFGILALQMDFVTRDALVAAMHAWALDKSKPLGLILCEQGALADGERSPLEALVDRHLARHGDDAEQSLAALRLGDAAGSELLSSLSPTPEGPPTVSVGPLPPLPPEGRYQRLRPHARGGLGEVWVAADRELDREVALKEIQERHAGQADSRARFLLEARVTGGLEHPGIVPVYGLGHHPDGRPYYAMRFVRGHSLREAIEAFHRADWQGKPGARALAFRQLLGRFIDVCDAIEYAHSRGVLHRDLKPGNVMLGKYGETLVVDWGLAKVTGRADVEATEGGLAASSGDSGLTQAGKALGTPAYMSPEQAAGRLEQLGPRSDIYSLGATLYTLLTNQAPFPQGEMGEILARVERGDFPAPRQVKKEVPRALEAVCLKAMAREPAQRYASPRALAGDIEHWLADEPVAVWTEPARLRLGRWARRHKPLVAAAATLLLAALAALAATTAVVRVQQQETERQRDLAVTERDRADRNFVLIEKALEETSTKIADHRRLKEADFHALRKELLVVAVPFYQELAAQKGGSARLEAARARTYLRLAKVRGEMEQADEATADLRQAEAIFRGLLAESPGVLDYLQGLAESRTTLASLLKDHSQLKAAAEANREAVKLWDDLVAAAPQVGEHRKGQARNYEGLGNALSSLGRQEEAEGAYRLALKIMTKLLADFPASAEYRRALASVHHNLAVQLYHAAKWAPAETEYNTALRLRQKLVEEFPAEFVYRQQQAMEYQSLATLLGRVGQRPAAVTAFETALAIQEKLVAEFPALPSCRQDLAQTCNNMSLAVLEPSRQEALAQRSLDLKAKLVADFPKVADFRDDLARGFMNRARRSLQRRRWQDAETDLRQARDIQAKLVAEFPDVIQYAVYQGFGFGATGDLDVARGKLPAALAWFDKSAATLEAAIARNWSQTIARIGFYDTHRKRAALLYDLKRHPEALQAVDVVIAGRDVPVNELVRMASFCAFAAGVKDNAGVAEEYAARAVRLLVRAQAAGHFREPAALAWLKNNRGLDSLRQRDDFRKLLAELEKAP